MKLKCKFSAASLVLRPNSWNIPKGCMMAGHEDQLMCQAPLNRPARCICWSCFHGHYHQHLKKNCEWASVAVNDNNNTKRQATLNRPARCICWSCFHGHYHQHLKKNCEWASVAVNDNSDNVTNLFWDIYSVTSHLTLSLLTIFRIFKRKAQKRDLLS